MPELPIDHLSYSSLMLLLRNPKVWEMKYIYNYYDKPLSMSASVGIACHKALEGYYGDVEGIPKEKDKRQEVVKDIALSYLEELKDKIDWGKVKDNDEKDKKFEKLKEQTAQALDFYFQEEPEFNEIVAVEQMMKAQKPQFIKDKRTFSIDFVSVPDLIEKDKKGRLIVHDFKFTKSFTNYDEEDPYKIIQAMFNYYTIKSELGEEPFAMIFHDIKITKNKDGSPQLRQWAVDMRHESYHIIFWNLIKDATAFLSGESKFLPNIADPMDGKWIWLVYSQGLSD